MEEDASAGVRVGFAFEPLEPGVEVLCGRTIFFDSPLPV